ncbi:RNA-directed DNA polymerase from mobile element jockey [Trichonephila clavipes]|nr:RNA-directed DNA polymerase from mobile element jockey [Trichonephila clavipes]
MKKHHQDNNDNFNTFQNLVVTFNMYWVKIMLFADALSRIHSISEINFEEIAEKQQTTDEELQKLLHNNSLKFKPSTLPSGKKLWCDISTQKIRPYIPQKFRFQIFQLIHGLAHPGIKSTVKLMIEKYVWSDIKKQVREWAKACIRCQKCKVSRHTKSKLGDFEQPDERFSVVHIDLIGKLPPSEGMQYCLTCIDRFSCWMEAIPIPEITAEIVGRAFYEKWICRFGVPAKIVTDQGRQFEAELFRSIAAICGAKVAHTTSYHPQCNGKVERLHRTLKGAIKAHNNIRWTESLPTVLLGLRAAIRPDISYTIAQMVYGTSIKLPGEFFDPPTINMDPQNFVAKLQQHMAELKPLKSPSNRKQNIFVHKDLKSCSHVFLRIDRVKKALEPPYEGPYTVHKMGYFPQLWKTASVIPILKPGKDPTLPDSFRPISLLPVLSKITEKIIQKRLCLHLNDNDILIPQQHGFRAGLSTSHQFLRVVEYIKSGFQDRKSTGAVFLDIQKAFDRVWHVGLLYKLIKIKTPPHLIKLINSFLNNRSFTVKVNNSHSSDRRIIAGTPQGSSISPILFNIYVNDIPLEPANPRFACLPMTRRSWHKVKNSHSLLTSYTSTLLN